jgi:prevent-host-death family protein
MIRSSVRRSRSNVKTVTAAKIAARFNDYLEASREQPVVVTRNGKPVAVLVAVQNQTEAEQVALGRVRPLRSILKEAHEQLQQGAGIPHDQFWRELEQTRTANQDASARGKKA